MTFTAHLTRSLTKAAVLFAFAAAIMVPAAQKPLTPWGHLNGGDLSGSTQLIAAHGCWSGPAPVDMAGKVPGHVVVTVGERTVYAGPRMVARALEQVFAGKDHGLLVRGFCR